MEITLTKGQYQVLRNLVSGKSNIEIAQALGVAEKTVKGHLTNIYRLTECTTCRQLIAKYYTKQIRVVQAAAYDEAMLKRAPTASDFL